MISDCIARFVQQVIHLLLWFIILLLPYGSSAQLWSGNLGLPIVNFTFGKGTGDPLSGSQSSFTYSNGCPPPGAYSIEHFLYGCASNTWIVLTGDHTNDYDGNYMLVNGATKVGTVLTETIKGLCNNTTYQLSGWLSNSMKDSACGGLPTLPNLTFSIEDPAGNILSSYNTGDLPIYGYKEWVEYGTYYTTPANATDLVIRITSNSLDTCGSGFLLDDVTFKPAGPAISITLNGDSNATVIDLCKGYSKPLQLECTYTAGFNNPVVQWQTSRDTGKIWRDIPGATSATYFIPHRNDSVVLYRMGLSEQGNAGNTKCTIYSERIWTNVHPIPDHTPIKTLLGCVSKNITLKATPGFLKYLWAGPDNFQSTDVEPLLLNLQQVNEGIYTVLLTGDFGCTAVDSIRLNIFPGTTISLKTKYDVCEGTVINLSATGTGKYEWIPSTGLSDAFIPNPVLATSDSIRYKVVLTNLYGCKDSALVDINVFKKPFVNAGFDKTILRGDTVILEGIVKGTAINFNWSPSDFISNISSPAPSVFPVVETRYILSANSTVGCGIASDEVIVKVFKELFVPNAFTPNGDGKNDIFRLGEAINSYTLLYFKIFNRWGLNVFSTTSPLSGWDGNIGGQPQETGLYIFHIEMKTRAGKTISRKGTVMLLR